MPDDVNESIYSVHITRIIGPFSVFYRIYIFSISNPKSIFCLIFFFLTMSQSHGLLSRKVMSDGYNLCVDPFQFCKIPEEFVLVFFHWLILVPFSARWSLNFVQSFHCICVASLSYFALCLVWPISVHSLTTCWTFSWSNLRNIHRSFLQVPLILSRM